MPFTFSHPAIVLPATYLDKRKYSLSALVIGSMTPDFEYFIRLRDYSQFSHTLTGMFWFDMPLGLILLFLYHNLVRDPLIEHMPFSLNVRFSESQKLKWNRHFRENTWVVLISLFVGIASHIFLDSFTHEGKYFADRIPLLADNMNILGYEISGAMVFQYVSSVIGGIIMILYIFNLPEGRYTGKRRIAFFWLIDFAIMLTVFFISRYVDHQTGRKLDSDVVVTLISGAMIGLILLSIFTTRKKKVMVYENLQRVKQRSVSSVRKEY
ncbi:MAG: DUF4184 family protein [Bacteroidota bacterium]|nr:DUF4184 family protein [Bacteroidota bacterium]